MRILVVHNRYRERGGEDAVVEVETGLLREAGHKVVTLESSNPQGPGAALALAGAPWNPAAVRRARRVVVETRPDVAHVHNTWFALSPAVIPALTGLGVPVVLTLHNYRLLCANAQLFRDGRICHDCVGSHPWHGVTHACFRGSRLQSMPAAATIALNRRRGTWVDHVAVFVALTSFGRDLFIRGGLPDDRIAVKPNPVPDPGARTSPPSAGRDVLFVGRLSPEKGVDQVVDAWPALAGTGLRLVVIGDGPERGRLEAMAGTDVEFTGLLPRGEVQRRMLAARALVFPSRCYEGMPLTVLEAMASGLPVLGSDLGSTPDLLGEHAGWTVPTEEPGAWATSLSRLGDGAIVDTTGRAARSRWSGRFSPSANVPVLEDIYRRAISAGPRL